MHESFLKVSVVTADDPNGERDEDEHAHHTGGDGERLEEEGHA
jgi:hypothetical protein